MAPISSGFVPSPLSSTWKSFSSHSFRVSQHSCTRRSFTAIPLRRSAITHPVMCSGDGGHGGGDAGINAGHSPSFDQSADVAVNHGNGHGHDTANHGNGEVSGSIHHGEAKKSQDERMGDSWLNSNDVDYSPSDGVVQGPSQAPTKEGVSTVGMNEKDAKFITACYEADVTTIQAALDDGQDVTVFDVNRRSALHFCAGHGLPTLCTRLLEMGADINSRDILGLTPLHMATGYKKLDTIKVLVDANADANIASLKGELAVEIAERMLENTPEKKFFMKNGDHAKLVEMVEILDIATELEEEEEQEEEDMVEETASAKFVVRVKPKDDSNTPRPPDPPVSDVKVTIRVKEPKK